MAQIALANLLERTGKAVLVGEGTGATMAWLAADKKPHLVAAVVAVEPAGPPAGTNSNKTSGGSRHFGSHVRFDAKVRQYGLADIPLTFDPPLAMRSRSLDLRPHAFLGAGGEPQTCMLQRTGGELFKNDPQARYNGWPAAGGPRHLVNLQMMRHAIFTAQASSHSTYDWATTEFLKQAGVDAINIRLEQYNISGNGHLLFLETNSDEIASLVNVWIGLNTLGQERVPSFKTKDEKGTNGGNRFGDRVRGIR